VKSRLIYVYNNDDNLCIFACLAYHLHSEKYLKIQCDGRCIHKFAERIAKKFYGNDFDYTQYKGFDTVSEIQDLCNALMLIYLIIHIMKKRIRINKKV
jgi:hypothetical protein